MLGSEETMAGNAVIAAGLAEGRSAQCTCCAVAARTGMMLFEAGGLKANPGSRSIGIGMAGRTRL